MAISIKKAIELAMAKGGSVENWTSSDAGVGGAWLVKYDGEGLLFNKSTTTLMQAMEIVRRIVAGQALIEMGYSADAVVKVGEHPDLRADGDIESFIRRALVLLKSQK